MSDLIRRLREEPKSRERLNGLSSAATVAWHDTCLEAADRIESDAAQIESLTSENTRLRALLQVVAEEDLDADAADGVTVLQVVIKEARDLLAIKEKIE